MFKKKKLSVILSILLVAGMVILLGLQAYAGLGAPENNSRIGMGPNAMNGVCMSPGSLCLDGIP